MRSAGAAPRGDEEEMADEGLGAAECFDSGESAVYRTLTAAHAKLFRAACQRHCTFVLPPNDLLPRKLSGEWLHRHVLVPSPLFRDQFHAWGCEEAVVERKGDQQHTLATYGPGWRTHAKVRVLRTETVHSQDGGSHEVVFVSAPLVASSRAERQQAARATRGQKANGDDERLPQPLSLCAITALLTRVGVPVSDIDDTVSRFLSTYVLVPGCEDDAAEEVRRLCDAVARRCVAAADPPLAMAQTEHNTEVVTCSVHCYVTARLHDKLWQHWLQLHRRKDATFLRRAQCLREHGTLQSLGAEAPFDSVPDERMDAAVAELSQMAKAITPLGKCACAKRAMDAVGQAVPEDLRESLAADDLLPLLARVLCLCPESHFEACLDFIQRFGTTPLFESSYGYAHASLAAAMEIVRQSGARMLSERGEDVSDDGDPAAADPAPAPPPDPPQLHPPFDVSLGGDAAAWRRRDRPGGYSRRSSARSFASRSEAALPTAAASSGGAAPAPRCGYDRPEGRRAAPVKAIAPREANDSGDFLASLLS
eukprot:TRINITY_DN55166_c0_g1_i1.p2 TRINITY_DN55166_c0_g1~~TRINITY_DN55166_c0_g1_i1.p2  ORF type:complete len:537 (+),score=156.15 TRINITY_DN55166_c0_g1_i1:215-1825(+)